MSLQLGGDVLPFNFELLHGRNEDWSIRVHNGEETIEVREVRIAGDSIHVRWPLYDSEFHGRITSEDRMEGFWHNRLRGPDYLIPFVAQAGITDRFSKSSTPHSSLLSGTWEATFSPGTPDAYPAIGHMPDGSAAGTFVTETGDYRYLAGRMTADSIVLSGFNGSQAFLFKAAARGDSLLGEFRSGNHWREPWVAVRNASFKLRDPDSLTFLRPGAELVDFRFPDLDGTFISPRDDRFRNKVLVVQVMGSWCPNCVDETRLLNELYETHHAEGLELLSVAFEKATDPDKAIVGLKRFRDHLNVKYPILYAGSAGKGNAAEKLPFLNHVMSFPTCVVIDHTGRVRKILTGIYGPSTGDHYVSYRLGLETLIKQLIEEARTGGSIKA
jgi:thiol-disulfide isomerase/thioredoxin